MYKIDTIYQLRDEYMAFIIRYNLLFLVKYDIPKIVITLETHIFKYLLSGLLSISKMLLQRGF